MMLLAATLSEATRTKSDPCMPIRYSILKNGYEMRLFKNNPERKHKSFRLLGADYTAKVCGGWSRFDVVTGSSSLALLCDAGGHF